MMTASELVKQAIWYAAQKLVDSNKNRYVPIPEPVLKRINLITRQTIEFLEQYRTLKDSIYASANLLELTQKTTQQTGDPELHFHSKTIAIQSLDDKSTEVVNISNRQVDLRRDVLKKLWNDDILLAAGRLMRDASMGVDYDPKDMGIVDEAKRRAPLLVVFANKVTLGIEQNPARLDPLDQAMNLVPAHPPIIWAQTNHPQEPQDDKITTIIKDCVSRELWTKEVLLAAGRITAARSLALTPSWEDIEKVGKADHRGRLSVVKLKAKEIVSKFKMEDDEIFCPTNLTHLIKKAILDVESSLNVSRSIDQAILYAVQEKVAQYVWTSHPEFTQAKANLEKHGEYYTAHGDVELVRVAQTMEYRMLNAVAALLQEKERERIDETQLSTISWLWGNTTSPTVESQEVSSELSKVIFEDEVKDQSNIGKLVLPTWLSRRQYTLQLTVADVTNELIDNSVKRAIKTISEEKKEKLEHEEKRKARETSWF